MKSFKEFNEGTLKDIFKKIIGKKNMHIFNRAVHEKKYKRALDLYHKMVQDINKNPKAHSGVPGAMVMNPKGLARTKAANILGIKPREFAKILDRKTRYEETGDKNEKL